MNTATSSATSSPDRGRCEGRFGVVIRYSRWRVSCGLTLAASGICEVPGPTKARLSLCQRPDGLRPAESTDRKTGTPKLEDDTLANT